MAPELLRGETTNTPSSDVYALGIVLYEVSSREDPYKGEITKDVLKLVADPVVNKRPLVPKGCPSDAEALFRDCVRANPIERPTAEEISVRLDKLEPEKFVFETRDSLRRRTSVAKQGTTAEDLLSQLFPEHIARALREGRKVEPEPHDCVTVYFSDIVSYTNISSDLTPTKVSSLLDRLYTKFDALTDIHDVFKVRSA